MKKKLPGHIIRILSLMMVVYYLFLSWVTHRAGFDHSEALFLSEKLRLLFETDEQTLLILGTTFPSIPFLSSIVFSPLGYLFAPIACSILFTVLLFYFILMDFNEDSSFSPRLFLPIVLIIFILHPGIIYSATSGRSNAASFFFFYMVYRSFFKFYQTQTSFYLSMSSIFLSCLIFCNFNFIWLLIAFFPFIVLVSLEGLKISKDQPPMNQYFEAINIRSQRRKLTNRTVAIYIVIFMLPFGAAGLFYYLNNTHAANGVYFLSSQYANWRVTGLDFIDGLLEQFADTNLRYQTQLVFQGYALLLTPLLIGTLFFFRGKLYETFTVISPFIWMSVILLSARYYLTIEYYLFLLILAFTILIFKISSRHKKGVLYPVLIIATVLNIGTGILYFKRTNDVLETQFYSVLTNSKTWFEPRTESENARIARFINEIADEGNKVLLDDAAAYTIVPYLESLKKVVLPLQESFVTVVENPPLGARYMVVAKRVNKLHNYTVLNAYNLALMQKRINLQPLMLLETDNWVVYSM
ncbi:MAG: hypothetical protein MH132_12945 [Hydrotalea sp.]|nr:hypothetical protein [Hydrotalea sp.]